MSLDQKRKAKNRTICEVLREVDDIAYESDIEQYKILRAKLIEAEKMAKKMSRKLYEYNKKWDKGWWEKNKDYEEDLLKRLERQEINKREDQDPSESSSTLSTEDN